MNGELLRRTLENNHMISLHTLSMIHDALGKVKGLEGDVVELGCFIGRTTRFMCETMKEAGIMKRVHVYDSFCGLPAQQEEDQGSLIDLKEGGCSGSKDEFLATFKGSGLYLPQINEGWFEDTLPHSLPDKICFAFLDGDRYASMKLSLESVIPRMTKGGIIVMHDYKVLAGAKQAIDEHSDSYKEFEVIGNECWAKL